MPCFSVQIQLEASRGRLEQVYNKESHTFKGILKIGHVVHFLFFFAHIELQYIKKCLNPTQSDSLVHCGLLFYPPSDTPPFAHSTIKKKKEKKENYFELPKFWSSFSYLHKC